MGNKLRKIKISVVIISTLVFFSCGKSKLEGFFYSKYSVNERFEQSNDFNKQNGFREITLSTDEYLFYVAGDCHIGETNNLKTFINQAETNNATAMVVVGDLTLSGKIDEYNKYRELFPPQDSINSFHIAGNHDLFIDGWENFHSIYGTSSYLFTVKTPNAKDLFICLDSGSGTLGSKQLDWLKNILKSRANYRRCVVFSHDNLFRIRHTTSTNQPVEELYVLTEMCIEYNIDMIVTGHDHKRNVVVLGSTTHITMDALLDDYSQEGYFKLNITKGDINYEFVSL